MARVTSLPCLAGAEDMVDGRRKKASSVYFKVRVLQNTQSFHRCSGFVFVFFSLLFRGEISRESFSSRMGVVKGKKKEKLAKREVHRDAREASDQAPKAIAFLTFRQHSSICSSSSPPSQRALSHSAIA